MSGGSFPVKGLAELGRYLDALPGKLRKNAISAGLTAAAAPVRAEARLLARKQTGLMAKAIKTGSPRKNEDGSFSVRIRLEGEHSYLGYFHEFGVERHLIARTGKGEGRVAIRKAKDGKGKVKNGVMKIGDKFVSGIIDHPGHAAHPFMRPALEAKADGAVEAFGLRIRAYLENVKVKTGYDAVAGANSLDDAA